MISTLSAQPNPPRLGVATGVSRARQRWGLMVAVVGVPALSAALLPMRSELGLDTVLLLLVLTSVVASAVGGLLPAAAATLISFGCANFFFTPPYGSFLVQQRNELIDLLVFLAVAALVGVITELGARARAGAEHARLEATWVTELGKREHGPDSVSQALADARAMFGMSSVALSDGKTTLAQAGAAQADDSVFAVPDGQGLQLIFSGPELLGHDRTLLTTLAATAGRLWRTAQLAEQARRAEELARIDELRASLLAAVGHDLRNPLAAIKVAVATLRQHEAALSPEDRGELLESVEADADRLSELVANLLDMSRIQAGALSVNPAPTGVLEVLTTVLRLGAERVRLAVPENLPMMLADAGLLERVIANLVDNADHHQPPGTPVVLSAEAVGNRVLIHIVDQGPGIAPGRYQEVFVPFQRFDDRGLSGVGLGLAIARGFTEAMGGTITPSQTPGGGLTMTVELKAADAPTTDR